MGCISREGPCPLAGFGQEDVPPSVVLACRQLPDEGRPGLGGLGGRGDEWKMGSLRFPRRQGTYK